MYYNRPFIKVAIKIISPLTQNKGFTRILKAVLPEAQFRKMIWLVNIPSELSFWDQYFKTKGLKWKENFEQRADPEFPLQDDLAKLVEHVSDNTIKILDVGAGPQTFIGKKLLNKRLIIEATDPLADDYIYIMKKHGIQPLVSPKEIQAEVIGSIFELNSFDLVVARNSLDHAHNPLIGIKELVKVTKINCYVYIITRLNEGKNQNYAGLHQWNFSIVDNAFYIDNGKVKFNVNQILSNCQISWDYDEIESWLKIKILKKK